MIVTPPRRDSYRSGSYNSYNNRYDNRYDNRYNNDYNNSYNSYNDYGSTNTRRRTSSGLGGKLAFLFILFVIVLAVIVMKNHKEQDPDTNTQFAVEPARTIYVNELERSVSWDDEYDAYYDPQTDCYFFLNTDVEPEIWQYWFESISSDYGNYGWMEYDYYEEQWYIQTGRNDWTVLPSKYKNNSDLWHFDE